MEFAVQLIHLSLQSEEYYNLIKGIPASGQSGFRVSALIYRELEKKTALQKHPDLKCSFLLDILQLPIRKTRILV